MPHGELAIYTMRSVAQYEADHIPLFCRFDTWEALEDLRETARAITHAIARNANQEMIKNSEIELYNGYVRFRDEFSRERSRPDFMKLLTDGIEIYLRNLNNLRAIVLPPPPPPRQPALRVGEMDFVLNARIGDQNQHVDVSIRGITTLRDIANVFNALGQDDNFNNPARPARQPPRNLPQ